METVTVACKLPNGLRLRLFRIEKQNEVILGGGTRTSEIHRDTGEEYILRGWSHPQNKAPEGEIISGAFLNHGVPKEFWDKWVTQNKDSAFLKEGLLFAGGKEADVRAQAKGDMKDVKSGLERLDPNAMPKGLKRVGVEAAVLV